MSENGRKRLKLLNFSKFQMCKVLYYLVLTKGGSRLKNFKRDNIKIISKSKDRRDYVNVFIAAEFGIKLSWETQENIFDRDRTRTCNPQIRGLVPYPLGHTTLLIHNVNK